MGRVENIARSMDGARALSTIEIPPMQDKVSAEEWKIRVDLAAAYRLVAHFGWDDIIFTHLSARVPGPDATSRTTAASATERVMARAVSRGATFIAPLSCMWPKASGIGTPIINTEDTGDHRGAQSKGNC